jgi:hypothetical protein
MTETVALKIVQRIASELSVQPRQVAAAVQLLDEGATVPFIARYRKEVTDNLDDTQLRNLEERLLYLRELEDRRATILASIDEQGKMTDELRAAIEGADSKQVLEDLYLPYKPKRRTRAQLVGHLALFFDAREDRRAAVFQFAQIEEPFLEITQLRIVEVVGHFLAVARDKRNSRAFVEELHRRCDLARLDGEFAGDALYDLECYGFRHRV